MLTMNVDSSPGAYVPEPGSSLSQDAPVHVNATGQGWSSALGGPLNPGPNRIRPAFWVHPEFDMILAMSFWAWVGIIFFAATATGVITYLLTRLRMERASTEGNRQLAEAVAALENEKAKFEQSAKGLEENARRKALDEFLADLHVEERRYVREHRLLFAHRKSLILEERMFFRNIPISNWVEHEIPVEEGADLDALAKTFSVFNAIEEATSAPRSSRKLLFRAG